MSHGHVVPNPDGSKVRCGGPGICNVCNKEFFEVNNITGAKQHIPTTDKELLKQLRLLALSLQSEIVLLKDRVNLLESQYDNLRNELFEHIRES